MSQQTNLPQAARHHLNLFGHFGAVHLPVSMPMDRSASASGNKTIRTQNNGKASGKRENAGNKFALLKEMEVEAEACRLCEISRTRNKLVFGTGDPDAGLVFVGEAPGRDEDLQGEPFVGRAGKLLNKMIAYIGMAREQVYIMNTLKCHPPGNRNPAVAEMDNCKDFFNGQLEIIQPRAIVALGSFAAQRLLNTDMSIGRLRGHFHEYRGIPVMPTYHPAYLLRNPSEENRNRIKSDLRQVAERFFSRTEFPD